MPVCYILIMKNKLVKVAAIQTAVSENIKANIDKTLQLVEQAAKQGANIIALQELYSTRYFPQYEGEDKDAFAHTIPGDSTLPFQAIAKKYGVVIIAPIYEKEKKKNGKCEYHNSAVVIDDKGKLLSTYRKVHIPQDPGFYEKEYFKESDSGYKVYKTKFGTFAVLICYDQWFPEAARSVRLLGAEMIFYPTAIGGIVGYEAEGDWHDAWETIQRGHAIANSLYVIGINRIGREDQMEFFGQSFISDPFGKILVRASKNKEEIITAELDLSRNEFYSEGWGFMRNRRPDTYKDLVGKKLIEKSKKLKNVSHYKDMKKHLGGKK